MHLLRFLHIQQLKVIVLILQLPHALDTKVMNLFGENFVGKFMRARGIYSPSVMFFPLTLRKLCKTESLKHHSYTPYLTHYPLNVRKAYIICGFNSWLQTAKNKLN